MEVVNTLDIDGTQWEMQDVEARNEIANLKTEVNVNIPKKFAIDEKRIDGIYKYAEGASIRECCNKINYTYEEYGIADVINHVFVNADNYTTGIYNLAIGGPAYLIIVQKLNNDYMSVIATGYSTPHILKAKKSDGVVSLGAIIPTIVVK